MIELSGQEVLAHLRPALTTTDMGVSKMADRKIDGNDGAGNAIAMARDNARDAALVEASKWHIRQAEAAMADREDFQAPEGFDESAITHFQNVALEFAATIAGDLQDAGFTTRQGASMAAHIMLDAAWAVATCGALAEGFEPKPERFMEAAKRAVERLDMDATKAKFVEQESEASHG